MFAVPCFFSCGRPRLTRTRDEFRFLPHRRDGFRFLTSIGRAAFLVSRRRLLFLALFFLSEPLTQAGGFRLLVRARWRAASSCTRANSTFHSRFCASCSRCSFASRSAVFLRRSSASTSHGFFFAGAGLGVSACVCWFVRKGSAGALESEAFKRSKALLMSFILSSRTALRLGSFSLSGCHCWASLPRFSFSCATVTPGSRPRIL